MNKKINQETFKKNMKKIAHAIQEDINNLIYEIEKIEDREYEKYKPRVKKYLNSLPNLYVYGNVGAGKTYNVKRIKNLGMYIKWTNFYRLQQQEDNKMFYDQKNLILKTSLLIIDDLGTSKFKYFTMELLFEIIDIRLENNLTTIITSNLSLKELYESMNNVDKLMSLRIIDRLKTYSKVNFDGQSLRK